MQDRGATAVGPRLCSVRARARAHTHTRPATKKYDRSERDFSTHTAIQPIQGAGVTLAGRDGGRRRAMTGAPQKVGRRAASS